VGHVRKSFNTVITNAATNTGQTMRSVTFLLDAWERRFPTPIEIPLRSLQDMWFLQIHLQDE
jgi:hypothetical protein